MLLHERLEGAPARCVRVGVCRARSVEAGRALSPLDLSNFFGLDEQDPASGVDEAPDQPARRGPIHLDTLLRHPDHRSAPSRSATVTTVIWHGGDCPRLAPRLWRRDAPVYFLPADVLEERVDIATCIGAIVDVVRVLVHVHHQHWAAAGEPLGVIRSPD